MLKHELSWIPGIPQGPSAEDGSPACAISDGGTFKWALAEGREGSWCSLAGGVDPGPLLSLLPLPLSDEHRRHVLFAVSLSVSPQAGITTTAMEISAASFPHVQC